MSPWPLNRMTSLIDCPHDALVGSRMKRIMGWVLLAVQRWRSKSLNHEVTDGGTPLHLSLALLDRAELCIVRLQQGKTLKARVDRTHWKMEPIVQVESCCS